LGRTKRVRELDVGKRGLIFRVETTYSGFQSDVVVKDSNHPDGIDRIYESDRGDSKFEDWWSR
jgi:hypothetical protein